MGITRSLRIVGSAVLAGTLLFSAAPAASADEIRDEQWPLQSFQADKVWQESTGKGVTVAVLDSGVNGNHPDLQGNVLPGKDFINGGRGDQQTTYNHGTGMASLIAAHGHGPGGADGMKGLAPDAKILPVTVIDEGESGTFSDRKSVLPEALIYAVDQGADIVNMSFIDLVLTEEAENAIAYAAEKDVLLVAGSGNEGTDGKYYPGAAPGVVAVGAVSKNGAVWEDSNYGPHLMLTAPGVNIRSASVTEPYQLSNGTSDSVAYVSAAAALLRAKFPDLTAGQIVNRLTQTAILPPSAESTTAPDPYYGYGIIRPYRALTEDVPTGSKNGPLKTPEGVASDQDPTAEQPEKNTGEQADGEGEESNSIVFVLIGVGGFVVLVLIIVLVVRSRKNRNGPPPGGWAGPSPQQSPTYRP